jgi:hypothetical protein
MVGHSSRGIDGVGVLAFAEWTSVVQEGGGLRRDEGLFAFGFVLGLDHGDFVEEGFGILGGH